MRHKVSLPVASSVLAVGFWLLSFSSIKLWVRTLFQIGNSLSVLKRQHSQMCWHNNLTINLIWPAFCAALCMTTIDFKLAGRKKGEYWVSKIRQYLKRFYTCKKIYKVLLKFHYYYNFFIKVAKTLRNRFQLISPAEKRDSNL